MGITGTWRNSLWVNDPARAAMHTADPAHGVTDVASPIAAQHTAPPTDTYPDLTEDYGVYAYDSSGMMPFDTTPIDHAAGPAFTTHHGDLDYQATRDAIHGMDYGAPHAHNYQPGDPLRTPEAKDSGAWFSGMPQVALQPNATNSGHPRASVNHPADDWRGQETGPFTIERHFPIGERHHDRRSYGLNVADTVDAPKRITPDGAPGTAARVVPSFTTPAADPTTAVYAPAPDVWAF